MLTIASTRCTTRVTNVIAARCQLCEISTGVCLVISTGVRLHPLAGAVDGRGEAGRLRAQLNDRRYLQRRR